MKKIISLFLALAMLCCVLPVVAESAEAAVYYLQTVTMEGTTYAASDFGMSLTLTLNADGTGSSDQNGEVSALTWSQDGEKVIITMNDSDTEGTITDEGLTLSDEETSMLFTTTPPVQPELGNIVAAADVSAFNGTWNCTYVDMAGQVMGTTLVASYWEMLFGSTDTTITVTDGNVAVFGGEAYAFTFADGKLTYSEEGNDISSQSVQLTDTGMLVLTMDGLELSCYCEAVAAE